MEHDPKKRNSDNVIDLESQRRRGRILAKKKKKATKGNGGATWGGHDVGSRPTKLNWKHYVQFIIFLAVLAYMLELCRR